MGIRPVLRPAPAPFRAVSRSPEKSSQIAGEKADSGPDGAGWGRMGPE